jgi:methionine-rich copper-binding protein CopC/putative copper export protein
MQKRQLLVIIVAFFIAMLAYIGTTAAFQPPVASAHAFVIGSDPVDGSTINTVPEAIHIYFNAPISALTTAHVYVVQNGSLVDITASPARIASNADQLTVPLKDPGTQPQGSYEVKWSAVADADGYTTHGIIGFNVGYSSTGLSGTPTLGPATSNSLNGPGGDRTLDFINALGVAWDWLVLLALTFWIGLLVMERLILFPHERTQVLLERVRKQSLSLQNLCLTVLFFGEIVLLVLRTARLTNVQGTAFNVGALLQLLVETNYGLLWLVRIIVIVLALLLLRLTNRVVPSIYAAMPPATATQAQRVLTRSGSLHPRVTQESPSGSTSSSSSSKINTKNTKNTKDVLERDQTRSPRTTSPALTLAQRNTPLWFLIAGVILFTRVLSGDTAQVLQPHISAIVFDWLYHIAQGIWFGGLTYLGYALLPLLPALDRDHNAETLGALQRRFRPFHLASMGVLTVCCLFLSEANIHDPQQLLTDPYGRTLLVESFLLIVMATLGLYMTFALAPRISRQALLLPVVGSELPARRTRQFALEHTGRHLKWIVTAQVWLSVGVLFCSALLAFYAPPIVFPAVNYSNSATQTDQTASPSKAQTQQVGDLSVTLQLLPGQVAQPNAVMLTITDRNGQPVTDAQVKLTTNMEVMDMGTTSTTIKGGNSIYSAAFDKGVFSMAGVWDITVSIQRPHQPAVQAHFKVNIT